MRGNGDAAIPPISAAPFSYFENVVRPQAGLIKARAKASTEPAKQRETKKPAMKQKADFAGLCIDCENRGTCIYAKVSGGVWHCEEYR